MPAAAQASTSGSRTGPSASGAGPAVVSNRNSSPAVDSDDGEDNDDEEGDEDFAEEDNNWEDWVDEDAESEAEQRLPTKALFSEDILASPEAVLEDAKKHGFDLVATIARLQLDFVQIIHLINYIRATSPSTEQLNSLQASAAFLDDDQYMKPVLEDDPLLQLDLEELALSYQPSTSSGHPASQTVDLQRRVSELQQALQVAQSELLTRQEAMEKLFRERYAGGESLSGAQDGQVDNRSKGKTRDDAGYFDSYSANEIHEIMLKDTVRTEAYRDFILNNPSIFKDAVVLDVGCGTGILSMFAAKAGAKKVFAVDASKVAFKAMRNVKDNGLSHVVEVIHGKVEDLDPQRIGQVDVIISEWMGYFLLYEAMLDSVIAARDRFLRPGGLVAPSQCSIMLCAAQSDALSKEIVGFWDDVYGFKMSAMSEDICKEADVRIVEEAIVASSVQNIKDVNIVTDRVKDCDFKTEFELRITKAGTIHGLLGWFDTFFTFDGRAVRDQAELKTNGQQSQEVYFSTGPFTKATHWKQVLFLFKEPLQGLKEGDALAGTFSCRKDVDYARGLEVEVVFGVNEGKKDKAQVWIVS